MPAMNSIKQVTSGLASSLFLTVGLTRLAEKTDPMFARDWRALANMTTGESCRWTELPCTFSRQTGR